MPRTRSISTLIHILSISSKDSRTNYSWSRFNSNKLLALILARSWQNNWI
jgi:hypothetical protein